MNLRFPKSHLLFSAAMIYAMFAAISCLFATESNALSAQRRTGNIKSIILNANPPEIRISLSAQPDYKIIQTEAREVLIALKDVSFSKSLKATGSGKPFITSTLFERIRRNIAILTVHTQGDVERHTSIWEADKSTLVVKLIGDQVVARQKSNRKLSLKRKTRKMQKPVRPQSYRRPILTAKQAPARRSVPTVSRPGISLLPPSLAPEQAPYKVEKEVSKTAGKAHIEDILTQAKMSECTGHRGFEEALGHFKQKKWRNAYDAFNQLLEMDSVSSRCLERAYFLRAFSHFKLSDPNDPEQSLISENLLFDTISYYPDSKFVPFSLFALGKLYLRNGNAPEAKGYFELIKHKYPDFEGYPEIAYELGRIQMDRQNFKSARSHFNEIINRYPNSLFATNAKIEIAKILYETNHFKDSLKLLNAIQEENPRKVFESPDFLLQMGNAYYHTQKYDKAREFLEKSYNFFPDIGTPDETLSRIGDTYVEEKQIEKAKKIFALVTEKYPGTNGFILSTIRLAENLEDMDKKKKLYQMIIDQYAENPMAKLAMLRIAELQNEEGNFEECIETLKKLLTERNRAIRRDANKLMEKSFRLLFEKLMAENDYPGILLRFEKDKLRITNFENPDILMLVGTAYLKGHLYGQAAEMFERANDNYETNKQPPELLYRYGCAQHESGKLDQAKELLTDFIKKNNNSNDVGDAYLRMGKILISQKKYQDSIAPLKRALDLSQTPTVQTDVLMETATAQHALKRYGDEVKGLQKIISLLPQLTEQTIDTILETYQKMGEAFTELKKLKPAAESFQKAIMAAERFNKTTKNKAQKKKVDKVYFKLGETYERDKQQDEAAKWFKKLATSEDPFWARLAQEKLRGIDIEKRHKANEKV